LAIFGRKKEESTASGANGAPTSSRPSSGPGSGETPHEFSPEKARKFFERARDVHEATNYEYAMTLWLNGLRLDPTNLEAVISFIRSCDAFLASKDGSRGPSKDTVNQFSGKGEVDRYLGYLLQFGVKPGDTEAAIHSAEIALKIGARESAAWLAERAFAAAGREKKPRKAHFVSVLDLFESLQKFDKALQAGEIAVRIDNTDARLQNRVRNLAAESTMSKGGYDNTGAEGGFRSNIKDSDKQRKLEESERVVKTEDQLTSQINETNAEYEKNPTDKPTITKLAKLLIERKTPQDIEKALHVLDKAYKDTQEYRFRRDANDLRLRIARAKVERLREAAEKNPDDPDSRTAYAEAQTAYTNAEIKEYEARVAAYPSDRGLKFELGRRLFDAGRYDDCIALLQDAKTDPKLKQKSQQYLGQAFQAIGFFDGAIDTYRAALEGVSSSESEIGMELRYGLMVSLQGRAEETRDIGSAEEAYKIASGIAIQSFSYKDIRTRREVLKDLVNKLKSGDKG